MSENESKTVEINVTLSRGTVVVLTLLLCAVLFVGWMAWGRDTALADEPVQAAAVTSTSSMRRYYRTASSYTTDEVFTACATGFHFASLWELLDPSNLIYDGSLPDAATFEADQGYGPPTGGNGYPRHGWIRTGYAADSTGSPGTSNCNAWTSTNDADYGSSAGLIFEWSSSTAANIFVWDTDTLSCDYNYGVWCVED